VNNNPTADSWPNSSLSVAPAATAVRNLITVVESPTAERVPSAGMASIGAPTLMISISGPAEDVGDSGSMDDTVSIKVHVAESGDCAGCSSISVAKMAATKTDSVRSAAVAAAPAEPSIPHRVGFSGDKECTLDFALGGGAAAAAAATKDTHIEAANVSFRRWEAEKALREDAAAAAAPPASPEPSGAESVTQEVTIDGPTTRSSKPETFVPQGPLPEASTSSFMSGFDLGDASGLSIGRIGGPEEEQVPAPLDPQQSSIMSSLADSVTWVDNRAAAIWHVNPLGDEGPAAEASTPSPGAHNLKAMLPGSAVPRAPRATPVSPVTPLPQLTLLSPHSSVPQSRIPRAPGTRDEDMTPPV
jgi:hypothetical protein